MTMALEGLKVLDLSRLAPGPFCSMLLGDLGADVLLVEAPPEQLPGRQPGQGQRPPGAGQGRGQAYNALGRNKRSIVLNLRSEEGREVFYKLARDADVVLEGFRPGVVSRLGVDYDTVSKINPRIIYCSLSGYGQTGPYNQLVGHDINYISIGGALGLIGWPDTPPAIPMNLLADFAGGGLHAAFAILAAVIAREKTGRGQYVDIAMSDGVLYLLASAISGYFASGNVPSRGATMLNGAAPHYNVYECADGKWLSLGSLEPHFWANLCKTVGREDFIPHQNDPAKRPEIAAYFKQTFKTKTRDEWFAIMQQTDICVGPVYALDEALADPQNLARGMVVEVEHPDLGKVKQVGIGPKLSDTPGAVRSTAPAPGQHTDSVLASLGYSAAEIAALREKGAVA
ncbi:MAG TPA: CaiB/BaiF CoA-transferase family protein [Dehalococcoidia bacterium]|nr:CaiB/BaiF CoA-transferase family protein [Dehalococcoidia bacterium]